MDLILQKKGHPTRYQILQEKQEGGNVLHMNNVFRGRIYPHILVILENGVVICCTSEKNQ
jgi:hypothetical protein